LRRVVDRDGAAERLSEYVQALGLETIPSVTWLPNLCALREQCVYPATRGRWPSFSARHAWLFREGSNGACELWESPAAMRLARLDAAACSAGLGTSRCVGAVRRPVPDLVRLAAALSGNRPTAIPKRTSSLVSLAETAAAGLFAFAVRDRGELVCVPRPRLRLDDAGRLHDWDGRPAVQSEGGRGLWFWRGVQMTESAGRSPDRVNPRRIAGWANAERRRVAIDRLGLASFVRGLGGEIVQEDDYGRLWRTRQQVGGESYVAVEVTNATAEPDGTHRRYFLRVPPDTRTARTAVAWTFGFEKPRAYQVAVET